MTRSIGLRSLALSVPDRALRNDYWREHFPRVVARAEERHRTVKQHERWQPGSVAAARERAPYLPDPFGGAKERRVIADHGSALELEARAARQALVAARIAPEKIDLLICSSLLPDHKGIGSATYLARELKLKGAAWNIESADSSALIAFQTACSLIATGQYRQALVVTSCTHSRATEDGDETAWGVGDAATAMVVGTVDEGAGHLGSHTMQPGEAGSGPYRLELDGDARPWYHLRRDPSERHLQGEPDGRHLTECTRRALDKAGLALGDVDHFICNTPFAWSAAFYARSLGLDPDQTLSVYPLYADTGPAQVGLTLFHAAQWKRFEPGEIVLLYADGAAASGCATVIRWSDVALGELPDGVSRQRLEDIETATLTDYRLRRLDAEVLRPARATSEAEERLRGLVADYAALAIDEPGIMELFTDDGEAAVETGSPTMREKAKSLIDTLENDLAEIFQRQSRQAKVDPTVAALSLLGIVHWGVCSYRAEGRLSRDEAVEQVTLLALHGLVPQPAEGPGWAPA